MLDANSFKQHLTGLIEQSINPVLFSAREIKSFRFIIAFSGGLDSHVLLHLMHQCRFKLIAIYIDHGLQVESADWVKHNQEICQQLGIAYKAIKVAAGAARGESPEASARGARYQALAAEMAEGDILLTAQHQQDQSETLLLQMLRTAGPAGLSAMPAVKAFACGWHVRPLLHVSQQALNGYAEKYQLNFIEDPSNNDQRFDRNFLRHSIFPLLEDRWPSIHATFANVCDLQAEAAELLNDMAAIDAVDIIDNNRLAIDKLTGLKRSRQRNLVRYWLQLNKLDIPTMKRMDEILGSVISAGHDKSPVVSWQQTEVRRFKGYLYALKQQPPIDSDLELDIIDKTCPAIPALGKALFFQSTEVGLNDRVFSQRLTVRFRQGGESIKPAGRHHTMDLKKLLQEAGIPPWERARIPLLYLDDSLIAVADLWVADQYKNSPGEPGWQLKTRFL